MKYLCGRINKDILFHLLIGQITKRKLFIIGLKLLNVLNFKKSTSLIQTKSVTTYNSYFWVEYKTDFKIQYFSFFLISIRQLKIIHD